jgi:fumarate reductase flavoprotein subunit
MRDVDVAILGAGAAGMLVALAAHDRGLSVLLADPMAEQASNFAISGGLFPAAGSRLQRAAGVSDSPLTWLADVRRFAPGGVNDSIADAVAHALPAVVDFLLDRVSVPLRFLPDVAAPGHSQVRFHSVDPASGAAFHRCFREALAARPGIVFLRQRLEVEPPWLQGAHTGRESLPEPSPSRTAEAAAVRFRLRAADEAERAAGPVWRARRLVLAGGGFGANAQMVARHIPAMAGALHNGSATNDGSAIALGVAWRAALWGMTGFQGQGHTNPGGATRLGMSIPTLGGILVNRAGQRFVREDVGPSALAPHVLAQPGGLALEVFDAAIESQLGHHSAYRQAVEAGQVITAHDVADLAAQVGIDASTLLETLAAVARYARGQQPDPLGRAGFARQLTPPFKGSWVTGALSHTQGGLRTDAEGRVLDAEGLPLPGVFASGGCAAGLAGEGAEGYLPGNGLAQAFGLGWCVAQAL